MTTIIILLCLWCVALLIWCCWLHHVDAPDRTQTELENENRELRHLVAEMYEWTHHKHTRWATRAAKALGQTDMGKDK